MQIDAEGGWAALVPGQIQTAMRRDPLNSIATALGQAGPCTKTDSRSGT